MEKCKQRLIQFDLLKLFAIYLVVLGHCVQHLLPTHPYDEPLYVYIYSFHMPLFMMISGFFSYKEELSFCSAWGGVKRRFQKLVVPVLFWSLIIVVIKALLYDVVYNYDFFYNEFFNTLWFLKSLFICYVVYVSVKVLNQRYRSFAIIFLMLLVPFMGWFHLTLMIPCFVIGVLSKKHALFERPVVLFASGMIFTACLFMWNADFFISPSGVIRGLSHRNYEPFSIFLYRYGGALITGVSGAMFFISLFCFLFDNIHIIVGERLSKYGQMTLGVYILQTVLLETIIPVFFQLSVNTLLIYWTVLPSLAFMIVIVCLLITRLLMHSRIINKLSLGGLVVK